MGNKPWSNSWVGKVPWRRDRLLTPVFLGFPGDPDGKESSRNVADLGSISGLERSPGGGHGIPLQYSGLENPQEQRSLEGYSPWGRKESDATEQQQPGFRTFPHFSFITCLILSFNSSTCFHISCRGIENRFIQAFEKQATELRWKFNYSSQTMVEVNGTSQSPDVSYNFANDKTS